MKNRTGAIAANDVFYNGSRHVCGRIRRYVSGGNCVLCARARASAYAKANRGYQLEWENSTGASQARSVVRYDIKKGLLQSLKETWVKCTDCSARATQHDHRDYNKPHDVEPVCRSCNRRRGPATPRKKGTRK